MSVRLPDDTDNNTAYGIDTNWGGSYSTFNASHIYRIGNGQVSSSFDNVFNIYGLNPPLNALYNVEFFKESTSTTWIFFTANNRAYKANWSIVDNNTNYSEPCDWINESEGTTCDTTDPTHRTYKTNTDNCHLTYGACPVGSLCSQLTPQFNVSTDLVENYTSCQIVTNGGLRYNCFNICFKGTVLFSNCVEDGCKQCPDSEGGITYNSEYGFFTNTWYSNQATVSVPSYTIACINSSTGTVVDIIDQNGNSTTEVELLSRAGNTVTSSEQNGTSTAGEDTSSYNYLLNNPMNWVAMGVGGLFSVRSLTTSQQISSILFSFVIAIALVLGIAVVGKGKMSSNSMITGFIVSAFGGLVMFTLMGWFPAWLMIVLIVIGSYIMAKTMGLGGD